MHALRVRLGQSRPALMDVRARFTNFGMPYPFAVAYVVCEDIEGCFGFRVVVRCTTDTLQELFVGGIERQPRATDGNFTASLPQVSVVQRRF